MTHMNATRTPIALVTGASRGLGRATALALAGRGTDVVLTYLTNADAARETVASIEALGRRAVALQLDGGDVATFDAFVVRLRAALAERFEADTIDYLVNNAGHGTYATFLETTQAQFDRLADVHLKGVFFLTQALVPLLADGGRIVNLSSGLTRFSMPGYAAYAAMKGAVEVLTRYLAAELGAREITVNTFAPGAIETDFGGGAVRDDAGINAAIAAQTVLGRVGRPEDIGPAIASLLADENRWINAQRIEASGGMRV